MKVGVNLIGISKGNFLGKNRDFKNCYDNFIKMIINPLENMGNEVFVYVTTYIGESNNELLELYQPRKSIFLEFNDSHQRETYIKGLELFDGEDLDLILCTRFDIFFKENIFNKNFDITKFNFCFKEQNMWETQNFVTDNLFIFPSKYLNDFKESLIFIHNLDENVSKNYSFMHHIYEPIKNRIGEENIVFLSDEIQFSHQNNFYNLIR
jgi:hypothetical protein